MCIKLKRHSWKKSSCFFTVVGLLFSFFYFFLCQSVCLSLSLRGGVCGGRRQNVQCIKCKRLWITVAGHTYVCLYPKHRCYLQPLHCFGCSFSSLIKYIVKSLCSYTSPHFLATMRVQTATAWPQLLWHFHTSCAAAVI
jgi:hypothetical protein